MGPGLQGPMLRQLQRGGASDDAPSKRRTLARVKARGHWAQDKSVRRCAEPGMARQLLGLPMLIAARALRPA
eukprot:4989890-Pyramimonas_sp.AAC.1